MRTRVAVVVATRNRARLLERTLAHLAELPERPAVVVVDDASTDATAAVARRAGARVVRTVRPIGAPARNAGVAAVAEPYVAFCDDDSWWEPGALEHAARLFDRHPRLGLINARILVGPRRELDPTCAHMAWGDLPGAPGLPGVPISGFLACGAVVRRSAFEEVGGFALRGVGGEEQLLALDLLGAGWELRYVEEIVAHHHPPGRKGSAAALRRRRVLLNDLSVAWLRYPLSEAAKLTVRLAARAPLDPAAAAALAGLAPLIPRLLRARRVAAPDVLHRLAAARSAD